MATVDLQQVNKVYANGEGAGSDEEDATATTGEGVARVAPHAKVKAGDRVTFAVQADGLQFFDPATEQAIWA